MAKSFIPRNVDFIIQNASRNESEVVFTANVIVTIIPSGCFFNPINALLKSSTEIKDFKGIFEDDIQFSPISLSEGVLAEVKGR